MKEEDDFKSISTDGEFQLLMITSLLDILISKGILTEEEFAKSISEFGKVFKNKKSGQNE